MSCTETVLGPRMREAIEGEKGSPHAGLFDTVELGDFIRGVELRKLQDFVDEKLRKLAAVLGGGKRPFMVEGSTEIVRVLGDDGIFTKSALEELLPHLRI